MKSSKNVPAKKFTQKAKIHLLDEGLGRQDTQPKNQTTYEEAMLRSLLADHKRIRVPEEALLLVSTISSLSPSINGLQHRFGMYIGKTLYKISASEKHYLLPEEPIADLVSFFENSGYDKITYNAFTDRPEIKIHNPHAPFIGANIHSFEAGIASGFVSAANHSFVSMIEVECSNNGSQHCRFISAPAQKDNTESIEVLDRLSNFIALRNAAAREPRPNGPATEYYSLLSTMPFDSTYISAVREIASYIGRSIGASSSFSSGKRGYNSAANVIRLLNLGEPSISNTKPLKMRISFNRLNSKKELVDVSLAFVNGLFASNMKNEAQARERSSSGRYVLEITEKAKG